MATDASHSEQHMTPILGADAEALINLNQKLTSLGIDDTIKLPSIVVLGDQSTGKSSLIEKISNIKVPKAAGLCTRTPIRIQLSSGRPPLREWECSISIEERYTYDKSSKLKRITKANPFGPWQLLPEPSTTPIETTQDRTKLIGLIHVAQTLVLDPDRKPGSTHEGSPDNLERFSPNVILINISFGHCPNLSFVDLPGVIQVSERGQPEYYTRLVENLARQWARDDNTCVLLVLPMVHDVSNSKSYAIVQSEQAHNHCMAVFTKPDLAQEEQRQDYLTRYFGEEAEEELEYGHQVVMLQDTEDSISDGAEISFFSQKPWSTLSAAMRKRLGVTNLTTLLREILFQKTNEALPENLTKVSDRIAQVEEKLKDMPAPPDANALPYQLREQVYIFETNVKQLFVSGSGQPSTTVSSRNKLMEIMHAFDKRIQIDTPTLVARSKAELEQLNEARELLEANSNESVATVQEDASNAVNSPAMKTRSVPVKGPHRFSLEEINKLNKDYYQNSIPGGIELRAVEAMHLESVKSWAATFDLFMKRIGKAIQSEVVQCVHSSFDALKHLPVHEKVERITTDYLDAIIECEQNRLKAFCDAEMKHPLSFDDMRLRTAEEEAYKKKSRVRTEKRLEVERLVQKANGLSSKRKAKELTIDDIGPDPWDVEVRMAAKTTAYYEVASHRFVDSICLNIFAVLLPQVREGGLVKHVKHRLGLDNLIEHRENIVALMTEDSERENRRRRLLSELARLQAGYDYITTVSEKLESQRFSQFRNDNGNIPRSQPALFGDGFSGGGSDTHHTSPPKRRITEADFDDEEQDQLQTPSKRAKSSVGRGGDSRQVRLPSRGRTIGPEDEMDEDGEEDY